MRLTTRSSAPPTISPNQGCGEIRHVLLLCLLLGNPATPQAAPRVVEASIATSGTVLLSLDARLGPDAAFACQEIGPVRQNCVLHAGHLGGVSSPTGHDGSKSHPLLALQRPQGLTVAPWHPGGSRVETVDPHLAAALEVAIQGQAAEMLAPRRTLVLQAPPDAIGRRDILLGGTAWSASHRARIAEDGTVRLESWMHVCNGTGFPRENVRLVLVSDQARAIVVPPSVPRLPLRIPPDPARAATLPSPAWGPRAAPLPSPAGRIARASPSLTALRPRSIPLPRRRTCFTDNPLAQSSASSSSSSSSTARSRPSRSPRRRQREGSCAASERAAHP